MVRVVCSEETLGSGWRRLEEEELGAASSLWATRGGFENEQAKLGGEGVMTVQADFDYDNLDTIVYPTTESDGIDGVTPVYESVCGPARMTAMEVVYSGSGEMEYICGIRLLPGDESVGFVERGSKRRTINLNGEGVLMVASSKWGIIDICFYRDNGPEDQGWFNGNRPEREHCTVRFSVRSLKNATGKGRELRLHSILDVSLQLLC